MAKDKDKNFILGASRQILYLLVLEQLPAFLSDVKMRKNEAAQ